MLDKDKKALKEFITDTNDTNDTLIELDKRTQSSVKPIPLAPIETDLEQFKKDVDKKINIAIEKATAQNLDFQWSNKQQEIDYINTHASSQLEIAAEFLKTSLATIQLVNDIANGKRDVFDQELLTSGLEMIEEAMSSLNELITTSNLEIKELSGVASSMIIDSLHQFNIKYEVVMDTMNRITNNLTGLVSQMNSFLDILPKEVHDQLEDFSNASVSLMRETKASFYAYWNSLGTKGKAVYTLVAAGGTYGIFQIFEAISNLLGI